MVSEYVAGLVAGFFMGVLTSIIGVACYVVETAL